MKKVLKVMMVLVVLVSLVIGRFYYSIYASEYQYNIDKENYQASSNLSLRLGTYNIKSMSYSKEALLDFNQDISNLDLDVICLQEVDKNAWRSGNYDMLKEMAEANGYPYYHFYSTMWILNGYYGLGILSKYPISEVSSQLLPNSLLKEPRILTKTKISFAGKQINIYNTHLTYENNDYRKAQMDFVKEAVDFDDYSILAGDFNSFGMNTNFEIEGIASVNQDKTYMTFSNFAAPDDIFYASKFTLEEQGLQQSTFSDHNLLYAEFNLSK